MSDQVEQLFQELTGAEPEQPEIEAPAVEEVVEATPEPEPEPVADVEQPKDEVRHVPLSTFLDMREEAKEAKREREELRKKLEAFEAKPQAAPDPYDDPEAFERHVSSQVEQRLVAQKFEMSDAIAREKHGDDVVEAAVEWAKGKAQADPTFVQGYMSQRNPVDWIVKQHKRDAMLGDIGDDPDAYVRRRAAELGLTAPTTAAAPAVAAPASRPAAPPRSIASDVSTSRSAPAESDPLAEMNAFFTKG